VKPGNVVYVNGQPRLADPGLVASLGHASSLVGTLGYLPPEGPGQSAADIYSLGKVLYEAATGMDRQAFPELPSAARDEELGPTFRNFNRILHIVCANNPDNRYPSATALAEDLERVSAGKPPHLLRTRRSRSMAIGVAAGLALGGLIWVLLAANDPATTQQDSPAKPRLIAHWPLDGNARDLVGTNHGKIIGATPAKDRHGNENGAMHFDGINDFIRLKESLPDMTSMTLTAWIRFEGNSTGMLLADDSEILGNDTFICVTPSFIGLRADRGGALLGHGVVPDYPGTSSWIKWTSKKGQWTHVVWVMEPDQSTLYLNGQKAGVLELSGRHIKYKHDRCSIGGWIQLAKDFRNPFHGGIDGIRIYNHAIANPEIQVLSDSN